MSNPPLARSALIAGATGAVGQALLALLLADARYGSVKVLSRRPLGIEHRKLEVLLLDETGPAGQGAKLLADSGVTLDRTRLALNLTPRALVVSTGAKGLSETAKLTLRMDY